MKHITFSVLFGALLIATVRGQSTNTFWSQWGANPQHTGAIAVTGQSLTTKLADIVYDPFVDQEKASFEGQRVSIGGNAMMRLGDGAKGRSNPPPHEGMKESDKPIVQANATPKAQQPLDPVYNVLPPTEQKLQLWAQSLPQIEDAENSQREWSGEYFAEWLATPQAGAWGAIPLVVLTRAEGGYRDGDYDIPAAQLEKERKEGQAKLALLSVNSKQIIVHSGRNMELEVPDDVTAAIRKVIEASRRRGKLGAAIAIAGLNSSYAAQEPTTSKDPGLDRYVWDLSPLYPNQAAWDAERAYILQRIKTIGQVRGTGQRNAAALADELDAVADLRTRGAKMAIYGFLVSSVDSSPIAHSKYDVGTALQTAAESAVAFLPQDVLAINETQLKTWLRDEPRLRRHRVRILRILREAPHALSPDLQAAVTSMSRWPQTSFDAWSALNQADLGWPTRKNADGKAVSLNLNGVINEFQGNEQIDAYETYLHKLQSLQDVYALLYTRRIEADLTIGRQREFTDGIDALWFLEDGMPEGSHQVMIDVARKKTLTVRRYVKLRGQSLELNRIAYRDLGLDPPAVDRQFPIADALDIAVQASAPLGEAYQQRLRHILAEKWMHLPPWPQKAQSYGIYPPVGGIPPFFVMSYKADYTTARRFMGGVTLMMSDADIPQDGIPENWDDAGIYGNGVIYVGDMLFDDYVTAHAKNRRERIAYLVNALDFDFRYFRYVMWAELDQRVQELIIEGKNPTGAEVSAIYLEVLRRYFGAEQPPVVEEIYGSEWMTNHLPFGNYQYQFWAPAMAMAASVVGATQPGDSKALKVVDELLGRSDYDRTYQMLNEVGIDLTRPEPYQALIDRMDRQLNELERLLDSKE